MSGSLPDDILLRFKHGFPVFFETGTSFGDTVQTALDCGFEQIYSVEFDEPTFLKSQKRFEKLDNVVIYKGDSVTALKMVLPFLTDPVVFWLDAHPDCGLGCTPLLDELEVIKGHEGLVTILIDDMRLMGKGKWSEVTLLKILDKLTEINPNFNIEFIDNQRAKGDILVATDKSIESLLK